MNWIARNGAAPAIYSRHWLSRFARSASFAALACGMDAAASAQDAPQAESSGIEDIVVTAQRREQNLQDVPIAVTAVTQESMEVNRVRNVADLAGLAPGFTARTNAGSTGNVTFIMRGVFAAASLAGADKQISTYVDGVYIGGARANVFDFPDIQRIEVLRGPQGTLFGRNATAGAISVVTRNPTGEFKVRQEFSYGNYEQLRTRTTVELPAFGPFSAYVSYVHDERNGDIRNAGAGIVWDRTSPFSNIGVQRSAKRLGDRNHDQIFAALRLAPSDNFSMTYKFDRSRDTFTGDGRAVSVINPNSAVGNLILQVIAAQPANSPLGPVILVPDYKRPKVVNNGWNVPGYQRNSGHSLTTELEIDDRFSVKNISAYRRSSVYGPQSVDGLPTMVFNAGALAAYAAFTRQPASVFAPLLGARFQTFGGANNSGAKQRSSETQLNYDSDFLTLTVGGLYFHQNEFVAGLPGMRQNFQYGPFSSLLPLGSIQETRVRTTSLAAYAQAEFHVTEQVDIVAGARITRDKRHGTFRTGGTYVPATPGSRSEGTLVNITEIPPGGFDYRKTKPNYSIGVNYKPSGELLFYGKYATAFMSGGSIAGQDFKPETVQSFELGAKTDLFDRRLRFNLALFHAKYKHAQSTQSGSNVGRPQVSVVVIDNGELTAKGFEAEITAAPVRGLTLGGGLGLNDVSVSGVDPRLIASFGGTRYEVSGLSKWTGNVFGQYDTPPLAGEAFVTGRLDMQFRSKFRSDPNPDVEITRPVFAPYEFVESQRIVNGRLALRNIEVGPAKLEVAFWARNLFDDRTASYALGFGDIYKTTNWQPARTYGADLFITF